MVIVFNIGGVDGFSSMILTVSPLFILISLMAGLVGLFLCSLRLRWNALIGIGIGLVGALAIVTYAVSNI